MKATKQIRPGWETEADQNVRAANDFIVSPDAHLVALLDGVFVVVVDLDNDRHTRRVYLNLPSAQRAADLARDRGHAATIALCQLTPMGVVA